MKIFIILLLTLCLPSNAASDLRTPAVIFREIVKYNVRVRKDEGGSKVGSGTVIATKAGTFVLTCAHVVDKAEDVFVDVDEEGKEIKSYEAHVDKLDEKEDLAFLHVTGDPRWPAVKLATKEPNLYEELYAVASPVSVMRQSSILRVNTKDAQFPGYEGHSLWTISGSMIPGMSGSSIFNFSGEVVSVVKSCLVLNRPPPQPPQVLVEGGFSIPLEDIRAFVKGY